MPGSRFQAVILGHHDNPEPYWAEPASSPAVTAVRLAAISWYGATVATKKLTITLPEEVLERISAMARAEGLPLSTYLTKLAEHRIRIEDGLAAMREWEEEDGPIP